MTKFNPAHPVPCVYLKHGAYWLVKRGKWTRLGTGLEESLAAFGRMQETPKGGMPDLIDRSLKVHLVNKAATTKEQYKHVAAILKRKLAQFAPEQVKPKHIAAIMDSMIESPNMANRLLSFTRKVFDNAMRWEEVEMNPCAGAKRYKEGARTRRLTIGEWWAIYDQAGPRLRVIMKLQYLTGQRIGDVLRIRRSQFTDVGIDFKQQKTGNRLTVKWSPELRQAVAEALELHGGTPALTLFLGRGGKAPDYRSVLLQWHTACKAAKVEDALPNDQRAQSASDAKLQGKDATGLLGHRNKAMTDRYLRDRNPEAFDGPTLRQALDVRQ